MKRLVLISAIVLLLALSAMPAPVQAAELNLILQYDTSYKSDFSPAGYPLVDGNQVVLPGAIEPTDIHQFSILLDVIGALDSPVEESLQSAILDMQLGPGLAPYVTSSYLANNPNYDPPGIPPTRPLWTTNADLGPADLLRIYVESGQLAAHGLDPGETMPIEIGSFLITWDTNLALFTGLHLEPSAGEAFPWSLWGGPDAVPLAAGAMHRSINPASISNDFDLLFIPEPSSLALAGLAMLGMTGMLRRARSHRAAPR